MAIPPVLWRTFSASLIHASPSSHGEGQLPSPDSLPLAMCLLFVFHFLVSTNCRHLCHHYFTLKLLNSLPNWAPFSQALSCSSQTTHWYHIHSPKIWVWYSFVDILHILQSQAQAQLLSVLWSFPWPSQPVDTFSFEPPVSSGKNILLAMFSDYFFYSPYWTVSFLWSKFLSLYSLSPLCP